ncbi:CAP domain-containing protein [Paenibacillus tarimensis]
MLLSVFVVSVHTEAAAQQSDFADVPQHHWGYENIKWAAENGIVQGDGKGSFHPSASVTEPEFLAMLLRAYQDEIEIPQPGRSEKWYMPYYKAAYDLSWPVSYRISEDKYTRGQVAVLIAYMTGNETDSTDKAVRYLLEQGLAKGKTSATVAGFKAADSLTRAEAVTFIKNVKDKHPSLLAISKNGLTLFDIALGDTEQSVIDKLGEPDREDPSENGFTWYIYNKDYAKYAQIGIWNGKAVALYSNAKGAWGSVNGIKDGITADALSGILHLNIDDSELFHDFGLYDKTVYYFDKFDNHTVDAILQISSLIGSPDTADDLLTKAYERQVLDLTNSFRLKHGVGLLEWDDLAAETARKHSQDMSERDYFDHTNPDGQSPFDRMTSDGIEYSLAAENIAAGYSDAFHVYNGWLNSAGHRKNMLNGELQRLGVGIYGKNYTQNFYTPR